MHDPLSKVFSKIINILFLYNVTGTSYGVLIGLLLLSLQDIISIYIPVFSLIKWYGFIILGILIFNIKPLTSNKYEDPKIEMQLKYIREMIKEGNFTAKEKKQIWENVINSTIIEFSNTTSDTENSDDNSAIE